MTALAFARGAPFANHRHHHWASIIKRALGADLEDKALAPMQRLLVHATWRLSSSRPVTNRPSAWSHDDQRKASERTRSSRETLALSLLQVAFASLLSINKLSPP